MILARNVICAVGSFASFDEIAAAAKRAGRGFSLDTESSTLEPDRRMAAAFEASRDRRNPSFGPKDAKLVKAHKAVAYVRSPPIKPAAAIEIAHQSLDLVAELFKLGVTAVKSESSGMAHGRDHWLALHKKAKNKKSVAVALLDAWVRFPILSDDESTIFSCGLHLLGLPDIEVAAGHGPKQAISAISTFGVQMIVAGERAGLRAIKQAGIDYERPSCERYEEDDFFFNPRGYVRV